MFRSLTTSKLEDVIEKKQNKDLYLNLGIVTFKIYFYNLKEIIIRF